MTGAYTMKSISDSVGLQRDAFHLYQLMVKPIYSPGMASKDSDIARWQNLPSWSYEMSMLLKGAVDSSRELSTTESIRDVETLSLMAAFWDLIYICYGHSNGIIAVTTVAEWLKVHRPVFNVKGRQSALGSVDSLISQYSVTENPEDNADYWDGVIIAASCGQMDSAIHLLKLHSSYSSDCAFRKEENELVQEMVKILDSASLSLFDHSQDAASWQSQVLQLQMDKKWEKCSHLYTQRGVNRVARLLLGSEQVAVEVASHWTELLVSRLLYRSQQSHIVHASELGPLAVACLTAMGGPASRVDSMALSILHRYTQDISSFCSSSFDPWFMAHAVELILLSIPGAFRAAEFRDTFVADYVSHLATSPSKLTLAALYASTCSGMESNLLEEVLLSQRIGSDEMRDEVIHLCIEYDQAKALTAICQRSGSFLWLSGDIRKTVEYYQKPENRGLLAAITDDLMERLLAASLAAANGSLTQDAWRLLDPLEGIPEVQDPDLKWLSLVHSLHRSTQSPGVQLPVPMDELVKGCNSRPRHLLLLLSALSRFLSNVDVTFSREDVLVSISALEEVFGFISCGLVPHMGSGVERVVKESHSMLMARITTQSFTVHA